MCEIDLQTPIRLNSPCPLLPEIDEMYDYHVTRRHGAERGPAFYKDALRYAQSQWIMGKPAQALLQIDKALMAGRPDDGGYPYAALVWIMERAASGKRGFLGNPVRHFQHLASRMRGSRAEIGRWRAWACFHLAELHLPTGGGFPRDGVQLAREGLWIPKVSVCLSALKSQGWAGEHAAVIELLKG